jgi:NADH:ubiquinone oxidoreductase subunit F (NADH-binding)
MTFECIILTLQYCLETFEQSDSCGKCDPCTRGQRDIKATSGTGG